MPRYNQHSGSGTGTGNSEEYDDTTLKLQKYTTMRGTFDEVKLLNTDYGDRILAKFNNVSVLDGVVMQRDDKPGTWKVFGFGDLGFNVGDDGLVYESYDANTDEFNGEMSADEILSHPRVQGFSEGPFGSTGTLWYTPVGVVVEDGNDIAVNEDIIDTPNTTEVPIGSVAMFLANRSWVRTLLKLVTESGNSVIETTENDKGRTVPVTEDRGWLTIDEPSLREEIADRTIELFIIEESQTFEGDDEETTWSTPILLDSKTSERITIDNDAEESNDSDADESADAEPEKAAATDGGAAAAQPSGNQSSTSTAAPEPSTEPDGDDTEADADADGAVPEVLDDLIDYFARTEGEVTADEFREFAADEVDDPDAVDWDAAAAQVAESAE